MDFRTEYIPKAAAVRLDPRKPAVLLGSCFADNVGSLREAFALERGGEPLRHSFQPGVGVACGGYGLGRRTDSGALEGTDGIRRSWDFPAAFAASSESECVREMRRSGSVPSRFVGFCGRADGEFRDFGRLFACRKPGTDGGKLP